MSYNTSSYKYISATGLVYTGATQLYSIRLTAGSDTASLTIYDWTSATGGAVVDVIKAAANTTESKTYKPTFIRSGIYAVLTGTSPNATIECDGNFTTTSTSTSTTTTSTSTSTS